MAAKPFYLLDTSPLSVLCGFPIQETPYIHTILEYVTLALPGTVATEIQGSGKIARAINPLLKTSSVIQIPIPDEPAILDRAYGTHLGSGERGTNQSRTSEPFTCRYR
jgi:hypothetical protein